MTQNAMLDQIRSLPAMLREVFDQFEREARDAFDHNLSLSARRLFLTGCGDSHHASLAGELAFESLAGLPTEPMTALQFGRYGVDYMPEGGPGTNLVVGISVSGEVSRTLEAIQRARKAGATVVALTGTPASRVAQAGNKTFMMTTAPFDFAPGVRSYIATLLALYLSAVRIGQVRGKLTRLEATQLHEELAGMADAADRAVQWCDEPARKLAEDWQDADEFVYAGDGPNFGTALFSAAKILEASGDVAVGQDLEEWAHLQYFARAVPTPTFIVTNAERGLSRGLEIAAAAKAIGRRVAAFVPEGETAISAQVDVALRFPRVREAFSPFVACVPGMLFAAHRADVIGEQFFRAFSGGRDVAGGGGISRIRTSEMIDL